MFRQHAVHIDWGSGECRLFRLPLRDEGRQLLEEVVGEVLKETRFE